MSQTDPAPSDPHQGVSAAVPEDQHKQSRERIWQATPDEVWKAVGKLVEGIAPWLVEFGSWIFGGLIAFTLLVMASLITVGPIDPAITVATAAFALALPLDLVGLILLRLVQDLKHVGFEEEVAQAFQEVGFTVGEQVASPTALEALRKRRTGTVLRYSLWILALTVLLTLTAMTAALWHMAWWIGVVFFFVMALISPAIVILALVTSQPPDSAEEKEQRRRYREEMIKQAKEQTKKNEEKA